MTYNALVKFSYVCDTPAKTIEVGFVLPIQYESSAGSLISQITKSASKPTAIFPFWCCKPNARDAFNVTPARVSSGVSWKSVVAMLSIINKDDAGEEPGFKSVAIAIGTF